MSEIQNKIFDLLYVFIPLILIISLFLLAEKFKKK